MSTHTLEETRGLPVSKRVLPQKDCPQRWQPCAIRERGEREKDAISERKGRDYKMDLDWEGESEENEIERGGEGGVGGGD